MKTTLAIQLLRINLANGGSMQSAQVVTLKSGATGPLPWLTQNRQCIPGASYKLNTSALLPSHGQTGIYSPGTIDRSYAIHIAIHINVVYDVLPMTCSAVRALLCR